MGNKGCVIVMMMSSKQRSHKELKKKSLDLIMSFLLLWKIACNLIAFTQMIRMQIVCHKVLNIGLLHICCTFFGVCFQDSFVEM